MNDYLDPHTVCGTHCEPGKCPGPTIPPNIYYSRENDNFYHAETNKGQGWQFYSVWEKWRDKFPTSPNDAIGPIVPEFNPAFDMPETPEQAVQILAAWGSPSTMTFSAAKAKKAHSLLRPLMDAAKQLEKNLPHDPAYYAAAEVKIFRKALKGLLKNEHR